ncbi:MAG: hypothetical protein HND47_24800 [Chloroflexi bacterium]|nr:hypothetical protein [Chloroflexota bacterium]
MHPYATDSDERIKVLLGIAFVSLLASWGLHSLFLALNFTPHWLLDVPSFAGFYYMFLKWFDKNLWRKSFFQKIGLIKVPYIAGNWDGYINSSYDEHKSQISATIQIKQTWTEIRITLETDNSISRSETASIITKTPDMALISYEYINEPKSQATSSMQIHRGTARHEYQIVDTYEIFNGGYYTGRERGTFGSLYFKREHK